MTNINIYEMKFNEIYKRKKHIGINRKCDEIKTRAGAFLRDAGQDLPIRRENFNFVNRSVN